VDGALNSVFRLSTVVVSVFTSLAMWAIVPLLLLGAYHVITHEESLETRRSRVVLGILLIIHVILSFVLPPRFGMDNTQPLMRWAVPTVATVVTTAMTVFVIRRRQDTHLFGAFFLYTIVNSVIQTGLFLLF
jgi:hypothetical protein